MEIDQGVITDEQIRFLASSLVAIDLLAPNATDQEVLFDLDMKSTAESVNMLRSRIAQVSWPSYTNPIFVDQGFAFLDDHLGILEPRLAHADVSPENILEFGKRRTLIDYEFVSTAWPRFYDLVNLTGTRVVLAPTLAPGFQQLFKYYSEAHGDFKTDDHAEQLNTVAMYRMLSLLWELGTEPNQHHNTGEKLTPELYARISSLISTILKGKLYIEATLQ